MKYTKLIQWHSLTPPLCKAPEAAVQRRCGDRLWRWKGCRKLQMLRDNAVNANLQPLRRHTPPALPRHAYVCHRHYSGALTQGSLYEENANLQPLSRLCRQLYQGTPTYVAAIIPFPLHSGAYRSSHKPNSVAQTNASPYTGEPI